MQTGLNRRGMIAGTAATLAACSLAKRARAGLPASKMRFGLVTYLWGEDMSLAELLSACEASDVLGVELRTEHKHGVEPSLSAAERKEIRKRFADSPVELVGYGSNCEYHSPDKSKLKANIELTKKYIELMHDCGGTGVKVKPNTLPQELTREHAVEQIGESLNEVAAYGEGYGQKIRVEVHGRGTSDLPVVRDIFKVADHSNVYVCWNCNEQDLEGEGLEANFGMVRDRFGDTIHIREMDVGNYPYPDLMKLLVKTDYEGWILLEARTDPKDKVAAMIEQREIFQRLTS